MKKQPLLVLLLLVCFTGYSQIKFEKGYFIDNNGTKTECYIKNIDWHDNPSQFEYKINEDDETKIVQINNIKEFAVADLKYIRSDVNIDRSSHKLDQLSTDRNPKFKKETLFLKLLVDGEAKLYLYEEGNLRRYFYQINNGEINQLVYKLYEISSNKVDKNNFYKQQLWTYMRCDSMKEKDAMGTQYTRNSLKKYFIKYNKCINPDFVNNQERRERDLFNLNIKPSVAFVSVKDRNRTNSVNDFGDFENKTIFKFGVEAEFIMPFNKNKWSIFIEPTYQSYDSDVEIFETTFAGTRRRNFKIEYKSIELPVGLRHYFFLNDKSKLFVNVAYVLDFEFDSKYFAQTNDFSSSESNLRSKTNVIGGLGFKYNNKYSIEARFGTGRQIAGKFNPENYDYQSISVIFGYTLF